VEKIFDADLENDFFDLLFPTEHLASSECKEGRAYWLSSRRLSEVAICRGKTKNGVAFEGIREKFGRYYLFSEYHYDDSEYFGTARPFVDLGEAPNIDDKAGLMEWILGQEIDLTQDKLDWLKHMPEKFQQLAVHEAEIASLAETLGLMHQLKNDLTTG